MTRASVNSSRIAIVASTPPMTGMRKSRSAIAAQPAPLRPDPERPVTTRKDALGKVVRQTFPRRINSQFGVFKPGQTVAGTAGPKHSGPIDIDFPHRGVEPAIRKHAVVKPLLREPIHAATGPDPKTAVEVFAD